MRCRACDRNLSDFESTRKSAACGDFLDMCNSCLGYIVGSVDTVESWEVFDGESDDLVTPSPLSSGGEPTAPVPLGSGPDADDSPDDEPVVF